MFRISSNILIVNLEKFVGQLDEYLITKIKMSDQFIVLYSKNSQHSNYVQQEIGVAKGNNKIIIPILLDAESKPDAMLNGISYLSIYDKERNIQILKLYKYVGQEVVRKNDSQMFLVLGAILLLGYVLFRN